MPDDDRFLSQWSYSVDEAPDNYRARSHWSASFDADIDPNLTIESYQINAPDDWTGSIPAENDATQQALVDVLADSMLVAVVTDTPCSVTADERITSCLYDVGSAGSMPVLVRRFAFDGRETVMLVFGHGEAQFDYLGGNFTPVPLTDAGEWFDG